MERAITASDANQRFSEMLRAVQRGETFVVTSRGRPVAKVTPVDDLDGQARKIDALLNRLESMPIRIVEDWTRDELYE